ncbi:MAG TPA: AMP-binding protein [Solirubrobacteraceae bacterium]|nr:AMP-binding protein [Solirubrobacteraceae bacterium]
MELTRLRELSGAAAPALTIGGTTHDYGELAGMCGALAARLDGLERIAFWAEPRLEACVAVLAAIECGVQAVPLNPKLGFAELAHIVTDSAPQALLAAPDDGGAGPLSGIPRIDVEPGGRGVLPDAPADPESVALVIYSSGTTGPPKGVLVPRRAIATNLDALADAWAWTESDRLVHALPIFHVHGLVLGLVGPLRRGGHVRHLGRFTPEAVVAAFADGDTTLFGVPTMYHRLAELAERDRAAARALAGARLLVSGSAGLPAATFERIERATGQRVVERYGLTETIMNTAVRADGERRPGEVGRPLPGVDVAVRADAGLGGAPAAGDAVPADGETIGEVHVRGPNLFLGYLNRPDATAEVMRDGWFATGDLATVAPDGYLRIVGRRSTDLIKTGGYKVGAGEVESALLEHPAVSEAAVTAAPDEDLGERIVAWVVPAPGAARPTARELADHVAARLAPHKRPREVRFLEELPRNAMGKVVKRRLGD